MSNKWNKNHLHNRLDSMFSDLDESSKLPGLSIFNQLNGWIWEIDPAGNFTKCNPDVEDLLGFKCETLMNQPISQIAEIDPQFVGFPRRLEDQANPARLEINFYHVDGTKVKTACYLAPLYGPHETFKGWTGMTVIEDQQVQLVVAEENNIDEADLPVPLQELLFDEESQLSIPHPQPIMATEETEGSAEVEEVLDGISKEDLEIISAKHKPEIREILQAIDKDPDRIWEPEELQLVEQVHNQLELALENANLFQQTQLALAETDEQARKLRLLNELSERLSQANNLTEVYNITAKISLEIFNADSSTVAIWNESWTDLEIRAAVGSHYENQIGFKVPRDDKIFYQPIEDYRIQVTTQVEGSGNSILSSSIAGPIYASGEKLGVLFVGREVVDAFDSQDETFMAQLLSILNSVVENKKLFLAIESALASTEEQARRLAELNKLSEMLSQAYTIESILSFTMEMSGHIIPCKVCQTALWDENLETFNLYEFREGQLIDSGQIIETKKTILAAATTQKLLITENQVENSLFTDVKKLAESLQIQSVIAAPLISGDKAVGAILIGNSRDYIYSSKDEALMQSISSITVSTLENRRLFRQIQRRSLQLETSAEVSRIASTILDPSELLPEVVELIKKGFDLYYAGIFITDVSGEMTGEPNRWAVLKAGSGIPGQKMLEEKHKLEIGGNSMIGTAIANAEPRIALDVRSETKFFRNPYLPDTRSEMALPLISRGQVLGALTIQSNQEGSFTSEDITSLQTMSDQLANAIENAHLFEQTEARAEELTILNEMARAYTQTMNVDRLIEHTFEYTGRLMNADNFYLALFQPDTETIEFKLFVEVGQPIPPPEPKISLGNGLTDWIIKTKLPMLISHDVTNRLVSMGIPIRGNPAVSWLGVPMLIGNQVLGVISVQSFDEDIHYNDHDLGLLGAVASQAAVAVDNALRFQQTQARAKYEQVMREITTRVHSSTNAETILKTAVREVSSALGRQAFIELFPDPDKSHSSSAGYPGTTNHDSENDQSNPLSNENQPGS